MPRPNRPRPPPSTQHLDETHDARLESYKDFLRIPSISALPEHAPDVRRAAEWLADALRTAGLENVAVEETRFHPVVYADWLHAEGAPTVLVYGHYDVQPVDPLDLWTSPPFEPVVVDGRMLARGAADDKGQVHAHAMAAAAILATRGGFPINVRYVFEGAEESGSEGLDAWLTANRDRLTADVAIISDTGFFEGNIPAITVSLRGLMYAQIDVVGSPVDLHSGSYGGAVQNPANALAGIIAALKGPDGRIRIPGFYDAVVALTDEEHAGDRRAPVRRGRRTESAATSGSWSARSATPRSSGAPRVPRSTSTACGAGSRGTAPRRSSRRTRTPRSAAGSCRRRTRTTSSRSSATSCWRSRRPGSRSRSRTSAAGGPAGRPSTIR